MSLKDHQRIAWLQRQSGYNLVSDDGGRWAVSGSGFQPIPEEGGFTNDVSVVTFVEPDDWKPTIAEAIDRAITKQREEQEE